MFNYKFLLALPLLLMPVFSFGQWVELPNPSVYHLYAIDVVTDDVIYAGGYGGSLVKSTDGGSTWNSVNFNLSDWVDEIQFLDENTGWIATLSGSTGAGHVLKTTDGGATWTTLHTMISYYGMHWFDESNGFIAGSDGKMFKTTDGGANWSVVNIQTLDLIVQVEFVDQNNGFALTVANDLFKTTDGGITWSSTYHSGMENMFFHDANNGYCVTYTGQIGKTTDGGMTYTYYQTPYNFALRDVYFVDQNIGFVVGGLDCTGGQCTQAPALLTTTDGGQTWIDNSHPYIGQQQGFYAIDVTPSGKPFTCGSNKIIMTNSALSVGGFDIAYEPLNVYPNPTSGAFNIEVPQEVSSIEIYNLQGQIVYSSSTNGALVMTFDIPNLVSGMYIIRATSGGSEIIRTQRLMVQGS